MAPYVDKVNETTSAGNDWLSYKRNAVDIVKNGILMPAVNGVYERPAGFLYNYFVAAIFEITGINDTWVSFAQLLLVGIGASVMYLTFRPDLGRIAAIVYLLLVTVLLVSERVFWNHLLSEALLASVLPWSFFSLRKAFDSRSAGLSCFAGIIAGLAVLTRPNVALIVPALAIVLFIYLREEPRRWLLPVLFCGSAAATQLLLIARNVIVSHRMSLGAMSPAFARTADWTVVHSVPLRETLSTDRFGSLRVYVDRLMICLGYVRELDIVVYPWVGIWIGILCYAFVMRRLRRTPPFGEAMIIAFAIAYLTPAIFFGELMNYAGRMIVPVFAGLLVLSIAGMARLNEAVRTRP